MKQITKAEIETLNYIIKYFVEHGYPPTNQELRAALNINSPSSMCKRLKRMKEKGLIDYVAGANRTITVNNMRIIINTTDIPVIQGGIYEH